MEQSVAKQFELYLARSDLKPASVRFKRQALNYFLKWFGNPCVADVNRANAEDYRMMLLNQPSERTGKKRSKSAANGYLANFKPFWFWLFDNGKIKTNPFKGLRLFKIPKQIKTTFTPEELSRLIRFSSLLWRIRICIGLQGCRRGEMLNINVRDIVLNQSNPHIIICPKKKTANTWPWSIKNEQDRYVGLPEKMFFSGNIVVDLHSDIVNRMEELPNNQPYLNLETKYYKRMIEHQNKSTLKNEHIEDPTGNFQRMFNALQKRAGLKKTYRFHELRAAFITQVTTDSRYGLAVAADAVGHANVQTTMGYQRYTGEMSLVANMSNLTEKCYQSNVS
jgi:integrase